MAKLKSQKRFPRSSNKLLPRCKWVNPANKLYVNYHDKEWGVSVHSDRKLFEMLILEGAQAGLSWETVLKKRSHYRKAFFNFDIKKVAAIKGPYIRQLLKNEGIIRHRGKIEATVTNAKACLQIQKEFGSLNKYLWSFVGGKPIVTRPKTLSEFVSKSKESDALSRDLKKRGAKFVGSTICYAFMQAVGMVDSHMKDCFRSKQ